MKAGNIEAMRSVKNALNGQRRRAGAAESGSYASMIGRWAHVAAALALLAPLPPIPAAFAQALDCASLKARLDAASSVNSGRAGQYSTALRRQQYELRRTEAYAASLGCNAGFFFGSGPAECDAIASRVEQMESNITQMQQRLQSGDEGDDNRRALAEDYNASCLGGTADPRLMPVDPDTPSIVDEGPPDREGQPRGGRVRALCVRHCDGGYFPITEDASSSSVEQLDTLCKAQCPNAEASLYTAAPSGGIETAVSLDGAPYTSLPAAFKFQKSFDATCSCKPPHQSWVDALAKAETLIESGKSDITVTKTMSDAMARPATQAPAPAATKDSRKKAARKAKPPAPAGAAVPGGVEPAPPPAPSGEEITQQLRRDAPML